MFGDAANAIGLLRALREKSSSTQKPMWESQLTAEARVRLACLWTDGQRSPCVSPLIKGARTWPPRGRPQVLVELALAHADRGEIHLARAALARSRVVGAYCIRSWSRSINAYYQAEIDWADGQLARGAQADRERSGWRAAQEHRDGRTVNSHAEVFPSSSGCGGAPGVVRRARNTRGAFGELAAGNIKRAEGRVRGTCSRMEGDIRK